MEASRNNIDINLSTTYGVNQTMFIGNSPTPFAILAPQWFWLANARKWMFQNVFKQGSDTLQDTFVTRLFPVFQVFFSSWHELYFHKSSSLMTRPRPSLISSCPCLMTSTIAGDDMRYSVSSFARFFEASRFRDLTAFFIKSSSSEMIWSAPKSSELSCVCMFAMTERF